MTAAGYTPDPADVVRYGAELHELAHGPHGEGCDTPSHCRPQVRRQFDRYAEVLLRLLEGDGRLLPADAKTRTEWGVFWPGDGMTPRTEHDARGIVARNRGTVLYHRSVSTWPDRSTLVRPWLPAPTTDTEATP